MKKVLLIALALVATVSTTKAQSISIIGGSAMGWDTDIVMSTDDNVIYTYEGLELDDFANGDGIKFRQDADWGTNWGAEDFPSGTGVQDGPNIQTVAGTYDVTFDRTTGVYSFSDSVLSTNDFTLASFSVFPNPSSDVWNIQSKTDLTITKVEVFNVLGKKVLTSTGETVQASSLNAGIYLARIEAEGVVSSIKLIKR